MLAPDTPKTALQEQLPEVPVEVAAFVRRRNLGTVEVPRALTGAIEAAAAASSTRSSKLQRKETVQLTQSLKQLSRTPGKGGTTMSLIDANAGSSDRKHRKKVSLNFHGWSHCQRCFSSHYTFCVRLPLCLECVQKQPIKQTLRDLRHGPLVSMTTQEGDDTDDSDAETPWDDSDAGKDKLRNAFGNHDLSGNFFTKMRLAAA